MKKILAALLISSLAPIAIAEVNQNNESPKFEHRKEMKEKFEQELGLTADQKAKIDAIKAKHAASRESQKAEIDAVLTPEQKAKLEQMKKDRPQHKGPRGERPQPPAGE